MPMWHICMFVFLRALCSLYTHYVQSFCVCNFVCKLIKALHCSPVCAAAIRPFSLTNEVSFLKCHCTYTYALNSNRCWFAMLRHFSAAPAWSLLFDMMAAWPPACFAYQSQQASRKAFNEQGYCCARLKCVMVFKSLNRSAPICRSPVRTRSTSQMSLQA